MKSAEIEKIGMDALNASKVALAEAKEAIFGGNNHYCYAMFYHLICFRRIDITTNSKFRKSTVSC
jgi:hypothetical protein